ncbi:AN1-like zinc finger protein [Xylariaceae sp. FL0804]|nr:AN1-like zinc finger protein [Xylariaceae sp. FL0804]
MASSSASTAAAAPDTTSYVEMDRDADATLIGRHCQLEYCNQLDFLPFFCQSCKKTFCLDHRTEDAHSCAHRGAWAQRRRQAELARPSAGEGRRMRDYVAEKPCAADGCRTTVGTALVPGVHCTGCNRDYCLPHRLREEHDCASKTPVGARPTGALEPARSALAKLRAWGTARRDQLQQTTSRALPRARPSSAAQRAAAVGRLKKTARGDARLPPERRVYLHVEAEAETTTARAGYSGAFFYSRDWAVGRLLDAAARSLQVENVNNQSADERDKLRVFHVEGGRVLEFGEKVGAVLASGNTVVLLRGVGPPPDLIEM